MGAEAVTIDAKNDALDNKWCLAKHFKLHLHPSTMRDGYNLTVEGGHGTLFIQNTYISQHVTQNSHVVLVWDKYIEISLDTSSEIHVNTLSIMFLMAYECGTIAFLMQTSSSPIRMDGVSRSRIS